jgi:hypothetical protein
MKWLSSNVPASVGQAVPDSVMAEQIAHDVVKEAQSMGAPSSIGDIAISSPASDAAGLGQAIISNNNNNATVPYEEDAAASAVDDPPEEDSTENQPQQAQASHSLEGASLLRELAKSPLSEKSLLVDASGGSDTDTSKPDGADGPDGVDAGKSDLGHARSSSVKKPISFKSVSVTKNFLKAAAVGSVARPNDKGRFLVLLVVPRS